MFISSSKHSFADCHERYGHADASNQGLNEPFFPNPCVREALLYNLAAHKVVHQVHVLSFGESEHNRILDIRTAEVLKPQMHSMGKSK